MKTLIVYHGGFKKSIHFRRSHSNPETVYSWVQYSGYICDILYDNTDPYLGRRGVTKRRNKPRFGKGTRAQNKTHFKNKYT